MGWDQGTGRQDVQSFLLELLGVDPNELLREAILYRMDKKGLAYKVVPHEGREEGDGLYGSFVPDKIVMSDGRVFVEALTLIQRGDDWGNDHYSFVEAGKPYTVRTEEWLYNPDSEDPYVTEEIMPGEEAMPSNLDELRAEGNATAPGMGDHIADFFASQGITSVRFEPGDDDGEVGC
jgi:hypothetical protein